MMKFMLSIVFILCSITTYSEEFEWEKMNIAESGQWQIRTSAMGNEGRIYFVSSSGRIIYSTDYGDSWIESNFFLPNNIKPGLSGYINIAVSSKNHIFLIRQKEDNIYKSTDDGKSWTQFTIPITIAYNSYIRITKKDEIFIIAEKKLYLSTDGGSNWEQIDLEFLNNRIIDFFDHDNNDLIYLATNRNAYKSNDLGQTWTEFEDHSILDNVYYYQYDFSEDGTLIVLNRRYSMLYATPSHDKLEQIYVSFNDFESVHVDANNNYIASTNDREIYKSTDNLISWQLVTINESPLTVYDQFRFLYSNKKRIYVYLAGLGYIYSDDMGENWISNNDKLLNCRTRSICFDNNDNIYVGTKDGSIWKSDYSNLKWEKTLSVDSWNFKAIASNSKGDIFVGGDNDGYYKFDNSDQKWYYYLFGYNIEPVTTFTNHPITHDMFAGTFSRQIYKSVDGGDIWQLLDSIDGDENDYIYSITFDSSGQYYASLAEQRGYIEESNEFVHASNGDTYKSRYFHNAYANLLEYRQEGDSRWIHCPGADSIPRITSLAIDNYNNLYVGTYGFGVFKSTDNGVSFSNISSIKMNFHVNRLMIDNIGHLWALTEGGLYKSFGIVQPVEEQYKSKASANVFPNPSVDLLTFNYSNIRSGLVTIQVNDLLGNKIKTIRESEFQLSGNYSIDIEVSDLTEGAYYIMIVKENETSAFKFIKTK